MTVDKFKLSALNKYRIKRLSMCGGLEHYDLLISLLSIKVNH